MTAKVIELFPGREIANEPSESTITSIDSFCEATTEEIAYDFPKNDLNSSRMRKTPFSRAYSIRHVDFPDYHIEGMLEGTQRTGIAYAHVRIRGATGGVEHTVLPIEYAMRVKDGSYVLVDEPQLFEPRLETAASDSPQVKFMKAAARRLDTPAQTFAESAENAGLPEDQITAQYLSAVIEACQEVSSRFYNAVKRVLAKQNSKDDADTIPHLQIVREL